MFLVVLGLVLSLAFAINFPRVIPSTVGVNVHFTRPPSPSTYPLLSQMGIRHARMDLTWQFIEKTPGVYDFGGAGYDQFVDDMTSHQITPYLILDYGNPLYDHGLSPYTDFGRQAFTRFALAAVRRYAGRGLIFEIWNEPNGGFWKPKPDVSAYCALANMVLTNVSAYYPNEIIVGPTTSGIDLDFLEGVFKCGLLQKFTAISVHPYGNTPPEEATHKYQEMRALMKKYGDEKKDILSGEWGFNDIDHRVKTVHRQGQYLSRQWAVNAMNDVPVSIWYDFHDDCLNTTWGECHFGTVYNNYSTKPAHFAAIAFTTHLNGYSYAQRLSSLPEHYILRFQDAAQTKGDVYTVWSLIDEPFELEVHVGSSKCFELFDFAGNVLEAKKCSDHDGKLGVPKQTGIVYCVPV